MFEIASAPTFTWQNLAEVVAAVGALGSASVGLVDATKFARGGISNAGWSRFKAGLVPYSLAFEQSIGPGWEDYFRAAWLNGAPKGDQLNSARNYIRLGLTESTANTLAKVCVVSAPALAAVARKIGAGKALNTSEFELVGRMDASIEARLGAAYERAEQIYRNSARVLAGAVAVGLALLAWRILLGQKPEYFGLSLLAGIVAVPVAPVVKDLISSLSAAAQAAKALKTLA